MNKYHSQQPFIIANHRIRATQVRVLSERGEALGIMSLPEAMEKAREEDKDLVLITEKAQPPVVKIIDLAKHKYQLQQRSAESRKKSRAQDIKEVRLTPFISENDFQARLKKITDFLKKGDKVRLSLMFKGRTITKKEFGYDLFSQVIAATQDIASVEMAPKMMGSKLIAQLMPSK